MMLSPFSRYGGDMDSWNPSLGHLSTWDPVDEFFSGVGGLGAGLPSGHLNQLSSIRPRIIQEGDQQKCLVNLRMGHDFAPEDLKIRVNNNVVTVDAKKRDQSQDGNHQVYQEVCRRFTLPEGVNAREVKSHLDHNGVLRIEAPVSGNALRAPREPRHVAIEHDDNM